MTKTTLLSLILLLPGLLPLRAEARGACMDLFSSSPKQITQYYFPSDLKVKEEHFSILSKSPTHGKMVKLIGRVFYKLQYNPLILREMSSALVYPTPIPATVGGGKNSLKKLLKSIKVRPSDQQINELLPIFNRYAEILENGHFSTKEYVVLVLLSQGLKVNGKPQAYEGKEVFKALEEHAQIADQGKSNRDTFEFSSPDIPSQIYDSQKKSHTVIPLAGKRVPIRWAGSMRSELMKNTMELNKKTVYQELFKHVLNSVLKKHRSTYESEMRLPGIKKNEKYGIYFFSQMVTTFEIAGNMVRERIDPEFHDRLLHSRTFLLDLAEHIFHRQYPGIKRGELIIPVLDYILFKTPLPETNTAIYQKLVDNAKKHLLPVKTELREHLDRDQLRENNRKDQKDLYLPLELIQSPIKDFFEPPPQKSANKRKTKNQSDSRTFERETETERRLLIDQNRDLTQFTPKNFSSEPIAARPIEEMKEGYEYQFYFNRHENYRRQRIVFSRETLEAFKEEPELGVQFISAIVMGFASTNASMSGIKYLRAFHSHKKDLFEVRQGRSDWRMLMTLEDGVWHTQKLIKKNDFDRAIRNY